MHVHMMVSHMHDGTFNGHIQIVELLLINKADVNATTRRGDRPIDIARQNNRFDIADLLQHFFLRACSTATCTDLLIPWNNNSASTKL